MRECAVGVSVNPVIAQIRFSRLLEDFIRKGPVSIELVRTLGQKTDGKKTAVRKVAKKGDLPAGENSPAGGRVYSFKAEGFASIDCLSNSVASGRSLRFNAFKNPSRSVAFSSKNSFGMSLTKLLVD